jgi:3-keto-disaccharide hydrolase
MRFQAVLAVALTLATGAEGAAQGEPIAIPFDAAHWQIEGNDAAPATYLGQAALRLHTGAATLRGVDFATGSIEYDVAFQAEPAFVGVYFHGDEAADTAENFYLRVHKNGGWDSNQYMPVTQGHATWQIYSGSEHSSKESYVIGGWNHVRIEVYEDSADVFINGRRSLRIPQLKATSRHGSISIDATAARENVSGQVYYANFRYRSAANARPADMPAARVFSAPGLIRGWQISDELGEADAVRRASLGDWSGVRWTALAVESNGVANLGRVIAKTPGTHFAVARFEVDAGQAGTKLLKVGYSDVVRLYVNGALLFQGDNRQYSHDPGFLGIVGLNDTLAVPLRRGRNEIAFLIEETSGGWAAEAQFVDPDALQSAAFDAPS